jgi:hypothetical protein
VVRVALAPDIPIKVATPAADALLTRLHTEIWEVSELEKAKGIPVEAQLLLAFDLADPQARQLAQRNMPAKFELGCDGAYVLSAPLRALRRLPLVPEPIAAGFFLARRTGFTRILVFTDGAAHPMYVARRSGVVENTTRQ